MKRSAQAFTLMEMLLALAVSAIVLAGIGGVFYSAMRLRERTAALLDESAPLHQAMSILRRDLQGALPPDMLAGDFLIGAVSSGIGQTIGLQFSTTTGAINDSTPWGDIQEVTYELREPTVRTSFTGRDLIRSVTRNLLTTTTLDYSEQFVLGNVETFEVEGFNGTDWQTSWDTSLSETNIPSAIRIRLQMASDLGTDSSQREPIELVIPLVIQSRTNQTSTASSSSTSGGGS